MRKPVGSGSNTFDFSWMLARLRHHTLWCTKGPWADPSDQRCHYRCYMPAWRRCGAGGTVLTALGAWGRLAVWRVGPACRVCRPTHSHLDHRQDRSAHQFFRSARLHLQAMSGYVGICRACQIASHDRDTNRAPSKRPNERGIARCGHRSRSAAIRPGYLDR